MSTYKGWDKEEVLHQCPRTEGFTPINVPRVALSEANSAPSPPKPATSKALHGTGSKTSRSTARKRVAPSKATRSRKRKKSNNSSKDLTVTRDLSNCGDAVKGRTQALQASADESDYGEDIDLPTSHHLVPIYLQTTSMDLVQQHPPMKSMHTVRTFAPHAQSVQKSLGHSYHGGSGRRLSNRCMTKQLPSPPNSGSVAQPGTTCTETHQEILGEPDELRESSFLASIQDAHDDENVAISRDSVVGESMKDKPTRTWKMNIREVDDGEDYGGALLSDDERALLRQVSAKRQTQSGRSPIVRLPFARFVLDRSPIFGASAATVLRTCFRIGEALSVGAQAVRTSRDVRIELYARVTSSQRQAVAANHLRQERIQSFVFKDLYHDNPPHLNGTYALWRQSPLWELDSRPFLRAGEGSSSIICRMVGRMQKVGGSLRMEVQSIWQASWDDVDAVAGIYTGPAQ